MGSLVSGRRIHLSGRIAVAACILLMGMAALGSDIEWKITDGWLTAREGGSDLLASQPHRPLSVMIDGADVLDGYEGEPSVTKLEDGSYEIRYDLSKGLITERYAPFKGMGEDAWLRTLRYTNTSPETQDLTGVALRVAPDVKADGETWTPRLFWMGEVAPRWIACVAYTSHEDAYGLEAEPRHVQSNVQAAWRLKTGQTATVGAQGIWVCPGDRGTFRRAAQRWYDAIGLHVVDNIPPWLPGGIYYKACADGNIQTRSSDVGGFDNFRHQLDYLADLGIDAILYHSVHQNQSGPNPMEGGWNVYGVQDYAKIDAISGGPEALERLADGTRRRGLHVLGELCLNGCQSPQAQALSEWGTYRRDGTRVTNFGGATLDYSSPPWQDVMAKTAHRLAFDFGFEGGRLDLGGGSGPNWASPLRNHASYSHLGGSLEMLAAISKGMTRDEWAPVLISEDLEHQPERYSITPVLYGFEQKQLLADGLPADLSDGGAICSVLTEFLQKENGSLPKGGLTVRTLNGLNELVAHGSATLRFGAGLARALQGCLMATDGVVQLVQEQEVGSFEALRRMNWARRRIPEFAHGEPDYHGVTYAPEVFSVLRIGTSAHALGISNLSAKEISGLVALPPSLGLPDGTPVYDGVSGREAIVSDGGFPWTLGAYETSLLRIGAPPIGQVPSRRFEGEPPSLPVASEPYRITFGEEGVYIRQGTLIVEIGRGMGPWHSVSKRQWSSPAGELRVLRNTSHGVQMRFEPSAGDVVPTVRITNCRKWYVSARTALWEDQLLRRHFPYPEESHYRWDRTMVWGKEATGMLYDGVYPSGRLWQSVIEPLHPENPSLAFEDEAGRALVLRVDDFDGANTVLTDCTDEMLSGMTPWTELPYGLELRFYGRDPLLGPRVPLLGLDPTWQLPSYDLSRQSNGVVTFSLTPVDGSPDSLLSAERLAPRPRSSQIDREGDRFIISEDGSLFYAEHGSVTWATPPHVSGPYRIEFLARQSSSHEQDEREMVSGYHAYFDGEEVHLEWTDFSVRNIGGAWFARVVTPPLDLDKPDHRFTVQTTMPWCAIVPRFTLVPSGQE